MAHKILVVDDEKDILDIISYNLRRENYEVFEASDGPEAIRKALLINPDLILLDIMLLGMDGVEVCRCMRENQQLNDTLIAFLTARNEEYAQIEGFDVGADDYIGKPIKPKVLMSRIKGLLRRKNDLSSGIELNSGDLTVNKENYAVTLGNEVFHLPRKEFHLLYLLMNKPGRVFTRHEILSQVWGSDIIVGDRTIDVHIRKLREKIGEDKIRTIKGIGYKFQN